MRLDFTNAQQLEAFFTAALLGAGFCIFYKTLCRIFRGGRVLLFVRDVLAFAAAGVASFCFLLLYCKGMLRLYIFLGEAVGFFLTEFTVARLYSKLLDFVIALLLRLFYVCILPFKKCAAVLKLVLERAKLRLKRALFKLYLHRKAVKERAEKGDNDGLRAKKRKKFLKKRKNSKKHLKQQAKLLYNCK